MRARAPGYSFDCDLIARLEGMKQQPAHMEDPLDTTCQEGKDSMWQVVIPLHDSVNMNSGGDAPLIAPTTTEILWPCEAKLPPRTCRVDYAKPHMEVGHWVLMRGDVWHRGGAVMSLPPEGPCSSPFRFTVKGGHEENVWPLLTIYMYPTHEDGSRVAGARR